jgi:hypothetical protein
MSRRTAPISGDRPTNPNAGGGAERFMKILLGI